MICSICKNPAGSDPYKSEDDEHVCEPCAVNGDLDYRLSAILDLIREVPKSEADMLLEAARLRERITAGPTTTADAKRLLERLGS